MHVVLGWFSRSALPAPVADEPALFGGPAARIDRALAAIVPDSYARTSFSGPDWGLTVCEVSDRDAWRWPVVAVEGDTTAVSLGVPLGLNTAAGAPALARRLLAGEDIHTDVVPPFGLLAIEGDRQMVAQQDWLGMCRLFRGEADGTIYLSSRPGLIADMIGRRPDHDGWSSYVACGHFGGDTSPFSGVRLFAPGERLTLTRKPGGGWDESSQIRTTADDLVHQGIELRSRPFAEILDVAADGVNAATSGIAQIYGAPITLGLSGGKDSRVLAASLLANGLIPRLRTNISTPAEGETAARLVEIMRERRGLTLDHDLVLVGRPESVTAIGLQERIQRLQSRYDYQFPSTYSVRWPGTGALPDDAPPPSYTSAGGEMATASWYLATDDERSRSQALRALDARLLSASGPSGPTESVLENERQRIAVLLNRGEALGLRGLELVDYIYIIERVRRWYSSAYTVGMVTPFLSPGFVAASFALTPQQKREQALHTNLLARFSPEWADVPFVSVTTGSSTAAQIWDGDGLEVVHALLDTVHSDLTGLMRREAVATAVVRSADGRGSSNTQKTLQQYATVAVASKDFDPQSVRHPTQTYESFLRAHRPSRLAPIVRQIQRSTVGRAVVDRVKRVIR